MLGVQSTFLAIDDAIFSSTESLKLEMCRAQRYPGNPVLRMGGRGAPDEQGASAYGTVLYMDGRFRMWYTGYRNFSERRPGYERLPVEETHFICYAESDDGVHWVKPDLGLYDMGGHRPNNVVGYGQFACVLHDPEDPAPERRFKMAAGVWPDEGGFFLGPRLGTSPDGLHWTYSEKGRRFNPRSNSMEVGTLYKVGDTYHFGGQALGFKDPEGNPLGRALGVWRSKDFEHWIDPEEPSFYIPNRPGGKEQTPQVHHGAAVWNRGNVLLGVYGYFYPPRAKKVPWDETPDPGYWWLFSDLGLVISHDGFHFCEPVPGHILLPLGEEGAWDGGSVWQNNGFVDVGDETWFWYGGEPYPLSTFYMDHQTGLAMLRRDGFGYRALDRGYLTGSFTTVPIRGIKQPNLRLFVNVEGLSPTTTLRLELQDAEQVPIPGYTAKECTSPQASGVKVPVRWGFRQWLEDLPVDTVCVKAHFSGEGRSPKVYALYFG